MKEDIDTMLAVIREAVCVRVADVQYGVALEHDLGQTDTERTAFSSEGAACDDQLDRLRSISIRALRDDYGLPLREPVYVLPYRLLHCRRRLYMLRKTCSMGRDMSRFIEVLDRIRVGVLEDLAHERFDEFYDTDAGRKLARDFLTALVDYDFATIAATADQHKRVKAGLRLILGLTEQELIVMRSVGRSHEWKTVGNSSEVGFGQIDL